MKKAVVLGASGGMGYAIVNELAERGIETIAFARTSEKLRGLFNGLESVKIHSGDVFQLPQLLEACTGADVIFHAINVPYGDWADKQPIIVQNILTAAQETGAKLAVVDNIYAYGRAAGGKVSEDTKKQPHTKKGKIRLQLENMVKAAGPKGVRALIAHFPDFYGPNAENTLLHYTFQAIVNNKSALYVGDQTLAREFIFTPDGAKALVELALRDDTYGQNWNVPGAGTISGEEIIRIARDVTGYTKRVGTVGRGKLFLAGLFNSLMREALEMMYLNEEPLVLSVQKYESTIGPLPKTPYAEGIRRTIEHLAHNR